jgi:hypothetical protein
MSERAVTTRQRSVVAVAIAGFALTLVSLVLTFSVAEGDARGHAFFHLMFGLAALALFIAIGLLWQPAPGSGGNSVRAAVLIVTALGAIGQLFESIGASGYDRFNDQSEIGFLTTVHSSSMILGPAVLLALPLGLITVIVVLIGRVRDWRGPAGPSASS